jgi:hypothetical protein
MSKKQKYEHFLKLLCLTDENNLTNRADQTGLKILDRLQLCLQFTFNVSVITNA